MRSRLTLSLAPVAAMSLVLALAAIIEACGGTAPREAVTVHLPPVSRFQETEAPPPTTPDRASLLREALMGIGGESTEGLGSRMQVRTLRIPRPARGATQRFNFEEGKRGWITALPRAEILASPAYADGKVFLGGGFASHRFYAFNAFRGDMEWSMAAPDGGPTAAIIYDDRVFYNTESCTLFVADLQTGEKLWSRWLGDPLMSQPAAAGRFVLSAYPKNGAHEFGAFEVSDGDPAWTIAIPADVIQAPQVVGDSAYFTTMDGSAFRVRWRDGRVMWRKDLSATSAVWVDGNRMMLSAKVGRDRERPIVVNAHNGNVVHRGVPVAAPYLAGESRDRILQAGQAGAWGSVPHGEHLGLRNIAAGWAFQGSSPAVADGRAYTAIGTQIRAREIATGEVVWQRDYAEGVGAQTISPPTVIGSQLVYGTVDGHLYFSDIDTGMIIRAYDLGEPVVFQPIVAQGWVYVATGEGNLIGLEVGDPEMDGWHMWGGNAQHHGLVDGAGTPHPELLASLQLPGRGTMRLGRFEDQEAETATDAMEEAAVIADEQPDLPLIGMNVQAEVSGFVARVSVTQTFDNPHERPIEALYLFPLPDDAAVDQMEMHIGDRVVRGEIKRRNTARRMYEEAREGGRRAALLEQQRPNLFAQSVANIQAHERIEVRLEYVQALPFRDGGYELTFPMRTPRTDAAASADAQPQADSVALNVNVRPGMPLVAVESPSHRIDVSQQARSARVMLAEQRTDRDFVLRYRVGGEHPDATVLSHRAPVRPDDDGEPNGYFSLVVQPPVGDVDAVTPRDVVFVVDRSSSMRGPAIEQAQTVIRNVIAGLGDEDRVNVLSVSDRVEALGEHVQPVGDVRDAAIQMVDAIRAVGSSDMVPAIEQALAHSSAEGRLPIVVLVSDGYIGDESVVLRAIAENLGDNRLYTLGVGSAINRFVLGRAAEVGRGRAMFASLGDAPDELSERFATLIDRPVFTDVEIDWGTLQVSDLYPRRAPDLFAGQPVIVHGRFDAGGTSRVKVRGTMNGRRFEREISVTLAKQDTTEPGSESHASLWARAAVRDRMNRIYLREDPALIEEITEIGLRHHLVTQWTSFVAIDDRPVVRSNNATISPARSLPGDPEIRIPAPEDARAVTVVLPFGETLVAGWEPELDRWTARFLVPRDAEEGTYPIEIIITHADGRQERTRVWYTVDASAPMLDVEVDGDVRPGETITLRATQRVTDADLEQVNWSRTTLTDERAQLLQDARRVEARVGDEVYDLEVTGPGTWAVQLEVPDEERFDLELIVVDLAANVRTQRVSLEVQ